ncbi:MAG: XRE family transcriptional regulator [Actinobacteria bacterium]|jgi:DNA-binding XRE family transcriptional regulator|nr:MAG: XRE family transcriptional regulator [Actinomycetota bacterium]
MKIDSTKLRELREQRSLSVRGLAKEASVSTETVYSIEHGKRQPNLKTLGKIALALGVNPEDLLTR